MNSRLLGGILLIIGTSVGAGMLGLPIAAAQLGFIGSVILLFICWFIMTSGALLILEVNLWLPQNNNLITMAKITLGPLGQIISWVIYLLLLYSLLCAYIAGGSDLFHHLLITCGIDIPSWLASCFFTLIFGLVVYLGIRSVDYVNRGLMLFKFGAFFILIIILMSFVSLDKLNQGSLQYITSASAITITASSFGFATIVPSLRIYFAGDVKKLRTAIIIGSTVPLICYILWDAVIMGVLPANGDHGLISIFNSTNSTSHLVVALDTEVARPIATFFTRLFTSICVLTSFLGVSLCLTDFFADGLQLEKKGKNKLIIFAITFIPALTIAICFPSVFINALSYAGIYSIILLILLPACMAWSGRYRRVIAKGFSVRGGKIFLGFLIIFSVGLIIKGVVG